MANIYATSQYVTMSRSKSRKKVPFKCSIPFGKVTPIGGTPQDILPGSTIKLDLSNVTRMLTPIAPIMDDISMDVYSFFCPWRILFSKTKNFFGENDQVAWTLVQNVNLPQIKFDFQGLDGIWTDTKQDFETRHYLYYVSAADSDGNRKLLASVFAGSLFDYFALPWVYPNWDLIKKIKEVYDLGQNDGIESIQAMPFRGVQMIYNEFFRNENVVDPILDLLYDENDFTLDLSEIVDMYINRADSASLTFNFWFLPSVNRYRDLFVTALPAPQRGPAVALPLSERYATVRTSTSDLITKNTTPLKMYFNGQNIQENTLHLGLGVDVSGYPLDGHSSDIGNRAIKTDVTSSGTAVYDTTIGGPSNLYADLSNVTMATVNQLRYAFATQRYYEKLSMSGARYHEYLRVMFGTRPADATLQRPQYLGGHHQHINVNQVLQTSETSSTPLGSTGAYSVSGFRAHTFTNSFSEFGIILTFATMRKQHTYCQGLDKYWTKKDIWDIYNPTFAHIGQVPVMKNEIYWQPLNSDVFGYNEAWYEYRDESAKVASLLNPLAPNNLSVFVLTDVYDEPPTLSENFVFEDPNGLDRVLVGSATYTDQFVCDFLFDYTISAVMPVHTTPGLIDHY